MRIVMTGIGDGEHFKRTVLTPVNLAEHAALLSPVEAQLLTLVHGKGARMWGWAAPGGSGPATTALAELAPGDQAWFHHDGEVRYVADVVTVLVNDALSQAVWGPGDRPGNVFTLADLRPAKISKAKVNELLGYSPHYQWRSAHLLSEVQSGLLAGAVHLAI